TFSCAAAAMAIATLKPASRATFGQRLKGHMISLKCGQNGAAQAEVCARVPLPFRLDRSLRCSIASPPYALDPFSPARTLSWLPFDGRATGLVLGPATGRLPEESGRVQLRCDRAAV